MWRYQLISCKSFAKSKIAKLCECVNLNYKNFTTLDYGTVYELAKVLMLDFGNMKINMIQQNKHNNWPQNLQMNMNIETQIRRQQTLNITIAKSTSVETYFLYQCYLIMCTSCWKQIHDPSCSKHCQALKFKLKAQWDCAHLKTPPDKILKKSNVHYNL